MVQWFNHTSDCPRRPNLHLLPKQPFMWVTFCREILWPIAWLQFNLGVPSKVSRRTSIPGKEHIIILEIMSDPQPADGKSQIAIGQNP